RSSRKAGSRNPPARPRCCRAPRQPDMWFAERPSFITDEAFAELLANGHRTAGGEDIDPMPVVKLFTPDSGATWLLTEIDPDDEDRAFGLCDLGLGCPELGWVRLSEITIVRGRLGLPVERDKRFTADKALSSYTAEAHRAGYIKVRGDR